MKFHFNKKSLETTIIMDCDYKTSSSMIKYKNSSIFEDTSCPVYNQKLESELNVRGMPLIESLKQNQNNLILCSIIYLVVVFYLKRSFKTKTLNVRRFSILWNLFLAAFSIIGFQRTFSEFLHIYNQYSFTGIVCHPLTLNGPNFLWMYLFILSKVVEFGDTFLLILRQKPVIFLHYYHHASVLIVSSYTFSRLFPVTRIYGIMNYFVHSLMYSYFTATSMGIKLPRFLSMTLTTLQILQMINGLVATVWYYYSCGSFTDQLDHHSALWCLSVYISYLILFMSFFIKSYLKPSNDGKKIK